MAGNTKDIPPYDKMYYAICDMTSRALDVLPDIPENRTARDLLQAGLDEAEELFMDIPDSQK